MPTTTHPYGPGMEHALPAHQGLGVWGAVAMFGAQVGSQLVGQWIAGGEGDIPNDVYYPESKLGVLYCPGPWDGAQIRQAIESLRADDPIRAEIARYFVTGVSQRDADKWARYGVPRTPLEQAGALIAEAHGGSDCQTGSESTAASSLIRRILSIEEERRRAPARVARASTQAVTQALTTEIVPGVPTPLLLAGAALLFFALRR